MRESRQRTGTPRAGRVRRAGPLGRERHTLALAGFVLLLLAVAVRLVYLQGFSAPAYAEMAEEQRTSEIEIPAQRGTIYDRDGEVLAISREASTVYASPRLVTEATATAQALATVLGGDSAVYAERLNRDSGFAYIARKVDPERAAAVEALELVGIGTMRDSVRSYPSGGLAAQVLGFVGTDDEGLAGLERHYDAVLRGTAGSLSFEHDLSGELAPGGVIQRTEPVHGSDIVLTIDRDIQHVAQESLARAVETWGAEAGSVVVMDPRNGEILAMASVPGFDPNRFAEADETAYRNRPITDVHEPGSTLKSLTTAAVLDAGLFEPDSMFKLPPSLQIAGRRIGEARPRAQVEWTLGEILANSSNVGTVKLGMALGAERLYEYLRAFGVTEPTGVDFPGEAQGFLPPVDEWSATSIANIPFGQGVSMTPLQLARAMAAIANGGELVTPHFLLANKGPGERTQGEPNPRALSAEASAATRELLVSAVTSGTGGAAAVEGYEVAGKTGTAQKPREDGGGYAGGGYIGSFTGFVPADDPRIVIVVTLDEPQAAIYGGVVAAPAFAEIASFSLSHLKIPPTPARAQ